MYPFNRPELKKSPLFVPAIRGFLLRPPIRPPIQPPTRQPFSPGALPHPIGSPLSNREPKTPSSFAGSQSSSSQLNIANYQSPSAAFASLSVLSPNIPLAKSNASIRTQASPVILKKPSVKRSLLGSETIVGAKPCPSCQSLTHKSANNKLCKNYKK